MSVYLSVSALPAEPFDVWSPNLVQKLTLIISWTSLMVQVIGQRLRLPSSKTLFPRFSNLSEQIPIPALCCDVMTSDDVTWRHVSS